MDAAIISIEECMPFLGKSRRTSERLIHLLAESYPNLLIRTEKRRLLIRRTEFFRVLSLEAECDMNEARTAMDRKVNRIIKDVRGAVLRIQALEDAARNARTKAKI